MFFGVFLFSGGSLRSECVGVRIPVYRIYNNILDILFVRYDIQDFWHPHIMTESTHPND